jgi:hypothetical protein
MPTPQLVPARPSGRAVLLAVQLMTLAEILELVPYSPTLTIDEYSIRRVLEVFEKAGVPAPALEDHPSPDDLSKALHAEMSAIKDTPLPAIEWQPMLNLFGDELESLVAASRLSIDSYRGGETPDNVAARLHTLTLIVMDLRGGYNALGIRDWFNRQRVQLHGHAPAEYLKREWSPGDDDIQQLIALAATVNDSVAT